MTRRRWLSVVAALLVLAGSLGWLVFYSSALEVDAIEVRGAQLLSSETVRDVLSIPEGTPLVRVDLAAVETALENISQIESATVSRDWPSTLVVQVTERSAPTSTDQPSRCLTR